MRLNYGDIAAQKVSERIAAPVATLTELKAIPADRRVDGMQVLVTADNSRWKFLGAGALTGDDLLVVAPTAGTGTWLRLPGAVDLRIAIAFGTADTTALLTMQAGQLLAVERTAWEITADWTGGAASAIGLSSSVNRGTDFTAKGDLLGGATGDVAAALTAALGFTAGTIGTDMDTLTKTRRLVLKSADTVKFDRITSAFTAGTGYAHVIGNLLKNDGA